MNGPFSGVSGRPIVAGWSQMPAARVLATIASIGAGLALGILVAAGQLELAVGIVFVPALLLTAAGRPLLGLGLWLCLAPLVIRGPAPAFWVVHRLLPLVTLLAAAAWFARRRGRLNQEQRWLLLAAGAFTLLALANVALLSQQPRFELVRLYDHLLVPLALMSALLLVAPAGVHDWQVIGRVGAFAIAVQLAALATAWLAPQLLPAEWTLKAGARGTGTLVDPAPFTVLVVAAAAMVVVAWLHARARLLRGLILALAAICALAVTLSFSRGSWLAGAAVVGLAVVRAPRRLWRPVAAAVVLAAYLAIGPLNGLGQAFADRLGERGQAMDRVTAVQDQFGQIARAPILGHGYGNLRGERIAAEGAGARLVGSHNTYLGLAADFGLPMSALYLSPVGLLAWRDRRLIGTAGGASRSILAMRLLWLALAFQAMVSLFMDMAQSHAVGTGAWWLTIGLIAIHGRSRGGQ